MKEEDDVWNGKGEDSRKGGKIGREDKVGISMAQSLRTEEERWGMDILSGKYICVGDPTRRGQKGVIHACLYKAQDRVPGEISKCRTAFLASSTGGSISLGTTRFGNLFCASRQCLVLQVEGSKS